MTGVWFGLDQPAPIMREGFGGTVAAPAWARFMTAATRGAKPDWYRMPSDVEKVKICRLTGMRAGPHCDEETHRRGEPAAGAWSARHFIHAAARDPGDPPEPKVYEDLFPVGRHALRDLHPP